MAKNVVIQKLIGLIVTSSPYRTVSWKIGFALTVGRSFMSSPRVYCIGAPFRKRENVSPERPLAVRKLVVEKLWRKFFSDPSQWWDNRSEKVNEKYPDFNHKRTQHALWLDNKLTPLWVTAELAAMAPGTIQVDIFSWNKRLERHVKAGHYEEAMELFQQMQREGVEPDKFTFVPVLQACSRQRALECGKQIHQQIIKAGHEIDDYLGSCLVYMYAKCGSIEDAGAVFNKMTTRNVVAWNTLILGYVNCQEGHQALELYRQMQSVGVDPDSVTFVGLLNACASLSDVEEGRRVHEELLLRGYESDIYVGSGLIDMYAKCGSIDDARHVFNKMPTRDVVVWNAMLVGYVHCGKCQEALELSRQMPREGVDLNPVTFVGLLNACASLAELEEGRHLHEKIVERGYESDSIVGNCLVDMYAKCGSIDDARQVFNKMSARDVVAWNAMLMGYVKCGNGKESLELYSQMKQDRVYPNPATFVALLNACAVVGGLEEGRRVHEHIIERGCELDVFVGSGLIDMYAKCGSIDDAQRVFNKMPMRDVVVWNAMLAGFSTHGYAREALRHFKQMWEVVKVDDFTFTSLLSACSHGGLVTEGLYYLESMSTVYNISPTVEHYNCAVDLLGRAGHLHEAEELIRCMPCDPGASVWTSLLGACRIHGNVELGENISNPVLESEPENSSGYVLLSNIYAAAGKYGQHSSRDEMTRSSNC